MVVDIKIKDFKHKARLQAGGHMAKAPATITNASVILRETVIKVWMMKNRSKHFWLTMEIVKIIIM